MDRLQEGLRTKRFGKNIFFSSKVGSTNDWAKELAKFGAAEGTIAIAETQTAGRGRLKREWVSPRGGLWFSIILRPKLKADEAVRIVFVAGLAVAEVLRELYKLKVETKWPNDVLVNDRKVCGILSEMGTTDAKVDFVIIGIGLNANINIEKAFSKELKATASSLETELVRRVQLEPLFRALLEKFERVYDLFLNEGFASILEEWKKYAGFFGCQVEVSSETEKWTGVALDVADDGSLIMKLKDGTIKHVLIGDVSLRRK